MDIRFLGHACFELTEGDTRVLIDPFLNGNPKAAVGPDEVDPTHIFLCPKTCTAVRTDHASRIDIYVGCRTHTIR